MISYNKLVPLSLMLIIMIMPFAFGADLFSAKENSKDFGINIDLDYKIAKTGDVFNFSTSTFYNGKGSSAPVVVAMNIVNLEDGAPVDPEDWSPERTQLIKTIKQGESIKQTWTIHSILDGNYLIYLVAVPKPSNVEETSLPVASSAVHLTVKPYTRLNPGGVLPVIITVPILLILLYVMLLYFRKKNLD